MKLDEIVKRARKLCEPYRVTDGRRFRLKDSDPVVKVVASQPRACVMVVLMSAWFCCGATIAAQTTRAELIAREQAAKAATLKPPVRDRAERAVRRIQNALLIQGHGLFASFDSVYSGGGFTVGGGYRRFYGDNTSWSARASFSLKNYKLIEVGTTSRDIAGGRVSLIGRAGWRDAPQVAWFGLGTSTSQDDRTNFRLQQGYVSGEIQMRPVFPIVVSGGVAYDDYTLESGKGSFPSIEERFTPVTAPGLGANPQYVHASAGAGVDWRRATPDYARHGGYYGLLFHDYQDVDGEFDFRRLDADVIQHIPILRETWVISLRGRLQTEVGADSTTPYFLLPSLGGGHSLRGFQSWRFRDKHALLMSAEWRWIPSRLALDMAFFYDAGKVAASRDDLGLDGMKSDFGIGARFHGLLATPLRIELARSNEGMQLVFAGSAAF